MIIPVYNVEPWLHDCLDSVAAQHGVDLEVVVVDDGSTDGSPGICEEYCGRYGWRLIRKENGGISSARNVGIEASTGDLLSFLDSDDVLHPDALRLMSLSLEKYSADVVECGFTRFPDGDEIGWRADGQDGIHVWDGNEALERLVSGRDAFVASWGKLYRRQVFEGIRFPEGRIHEDMSVTPLVVERAGAYVKLERKLYGYRKRAGSIIENSLSNAGQCDHCIALRERYEHFSSKGGYVSDCNAFRYLLDLDNLIAKGIAPDGESVEELCRERKKLVREHGRVSSLSLPRRIHYFLRGVSPKAGSAYLKLTAFVRRSIDRFHRG